MQCDVCGTEVAAHHKFCMECGARLATNLDTTTATDRPALPAGRGHPMFDPTTGQLLAGAPPADAADPPDEPATALPDDDDATSVLPALGPPVTTFAPPDPTPGRGLPWSTYLRPPVPPTPPAANAVPPPPGVDEYPVWPAEPLASGSYERGRYYEPTRAQYVADPYAPDPYAPEPGPPPYAPTSHVPVAYLPWEGEPAEGADRDDARPREFRVKPLLVLTILAVLAAALAMFSDVIVIGAPGSPDDGSWRINDFGTNLTVAGIVTALAMLVGALAWCGGFRWGAGLAGGAGAGLAGWAILPIGAAETTLGTARLGGATAGLTRELGFWSLVAAGGLGLVVLLVSLARAGDDRRAGLDPWVAALGAAATITAVIGPLIPLNGASIDENWSSPPGADYPDIYFVARFANLGLLLLCGVFGFLLVRRYGLGMVFGGGVAVGWLVLTGAMQQTEKPIGPAYFNPGAAPSGAPPWTLSPEQWATIADDLKPQVVTIAGIALVGFFALVATAMALIDSD